jgi:hypothetical protein
LEDAEDAVAVNRTAVILDHGLAHTSCRQTLSCLKIRWLTKASVRRWCPGEIVVPDVGTDMH